MEPIHAHLPTRIETSLWRFGTLPRVQRRFGDLASPHLASRPLFGYDVYLDLARSDAHRLLFAEGERFVPERRLLDELIAPGDHVVDVGANIGYYMLYFARRVRPHGRVTCFEPGPANHRELVRNRERNGIEQVELRREAVGASQGEVLFDSALNGQVVSDESASRAGDGERIQVRQVRLDDVLEPPVDLLKIDVDGYEGEVLDGAAGLLAAHRPHVFLELHPWLLPASRDAADLLSLLDRYYPRLEIYRPRRGRGALAKLRERYLDPYAVRRLERGSAEVAACLDRSVPEAVWVVARRPEA